MKIVSVTIHSFGKLQGFHRDFHDGVNVLYQSNGYGKTTLASFIRAMLYGFKRTNNTKNSAENPADVMSAWVTWNSTEKIGGNMVVCHNGETYKIERFFGATARQESLSVVNVKTLRPVVMDCSVGEYFLGLTAESYDRSAYYPQESVEISSNENLNGRLAGMVQNADEDLDKVQAKLKEYKKYFKYERGNGGEIYRLETERLSLLRQIEERKRAQSQQKEIDTRQVAIAKEQQAIKAQHDEANAKLQQLQKQLAVSSPSETEIHNRQRASELQTKLARMGDMEEDKQRCDQLADKIAHTPDAATVQRPVSRPMRIGGIAAVVLGAVLAIVGALGLAIQFVGQATGVSLLVAGVACIVVGGLLRVFAGRTKPAIMTLQAGEKDQLVTDYFTIAGRYFYCERMSYDEVRQTFGKLYLEYVGDKRELDTLLQTIGPAHPEQDDLQDKAQHQREIIERLQSQAMQLSAESGRLAEARNNLQTDYLELTEKVEEITAQIQTAKHRYEIAVKVAELLNTANENLATSYLPDLCRHTQNLLNEVTGENYQLEMDNNFALKVVVNGASRSLESFSRGIREITLLCFRLAISHLLFGGKVPFLIIDDAFVNFDEQNFSRATALIKSLTGTQVIYFTCHKRLGNLQ